MNETSARHVTLIRALETTAPADAPWSAADAAWASRAATEVVGEGADADRFLSRRGQLAVEKLGDRDKAFKRLASGRNWRPWVGTVLVALSFALGVLMDAVGPTRYVNLLAFPLLGLIVWNLLVYVGILVHGLSDPFRSTAPKKGVLRRAVARLGGALHEGVVDAGQGTPGTRFRAEWARVSAPLTARRVGRVLHLGAMAFALGAIAALYTRGLVLHFQAGWESTFLDASQVHQALSLLLGPASSVTGLPIPDAAHMETLRFPDNQGENAAPWIHLFATTLILTVVLPRAVLALLSGFAARHLERHFPLPLTDSYFQNLQRSYTGQGAHLHLVPYSYDLSPAAALQLKEAIVSAFGPRATLHLSPPVAFGEEDALPASAVPAAGTTLAVALFSLAATPEDENHGSFLAALTARLPAGTPLAALVDEAGFMARFAGQPERLEERRRAWTRLFEKHTIEPAFVNLDAAPAGVADSLTRLIDLSARKEASR
ncbi:MAG TPA: DUF2868 domain-containing protein [Zoogloea sp.]|nr:DUF2868 domain-containing protein [Zoogloea sp.]